MVGLKLCLVRRLLPEDPITDFNEPGKEEK